MPNSIAMASAIEKVADAIASGFKLISQIISGAEFKRLKYRVEAATNYIFVDEKIGEYGGISEERQKDLKLHFRKRVFDET